MMWKIADGVEERLYDEVDICTYIYIYVIYISTRQRELRLEGKSGVYRAVPRGSRKS